MGGIDGLFGNLDCLLENRSGSSSFDSLLVDVVPVMVPQVVLSVDGPKALAVFSFSNVDGA